MSDNLIPKEALDYIKNKGLKIGFSYKDVWNEEHATAFTVAKAMQVDVLYDMKKAVEKAIAEGQSFESFKKNIKPTLQQKGWWGKKKMLDPLTGEEVDAQLGSDRRLKTIYNVNTRSAYQKGQYDRTMESDLHPYMVYLLGNSRKHREEHVAWNGLILRKDDPWWDTHLPPNGYGCNCYTRAVTEQRKSRYEKEGIRIAPKADGSGGGTIKVKTKAPPNDYQTYWNERKGTTERIPKGITPSFSFNQGKTSRSTAALSSCIKKVEDKVLPEQVKPVVDALLTNRASKLDHINFVDNAWVKPRKKGEKYIRPKLDQKYTSPVGFFDRQTVKALAKEGIVIGEQNLIMLEAGLMQSAKFSIRHAIVGNAPTKTDWYNLMDYLIDADVYYDDEKLVYLKKKSESKYMKIVVDISMQNKSFKGVALQLPKVDTMYELDLSTEKDRGINEFQRITSEMKKIR